MELDRIEQMNLRFDFYGQLLTQRQREVLNLYYGENLSLAEIAREFSISRQGVHDTLKHAEKALEDYEEKLHLVRKFQDTHAAITKIDKIIAPLLEGCGQNSAELLQIKTIIEKLDQ